MDNGVVNTDARVSKEYNVIGLFAFKSAFSCNLAILELAFSCKIQTSELAFS